MLRHYVFIVSTFCFCISAALSPAAAQNNALSYISGDNTTQNTTCVRAAPCDSLSRAISQTAAGGTIICLDAPVLAGPVLIQRSVTIDCGNVTLVARGAINGDSLTGSFVTIDIPTSEALRQVRLIGLIVEGAEGAHRNGPNGIAIKSASTVYVSKSKIQNMVHSGILDTRTGGQTKLIVEDSDISDNGGPGILAGASAVGITVLNNVRLVNNGYGIAAATGNNVVINRSVISGNVTAGVETDGGAQINVQSSTLSHNNIAVQSGGTVRLSDNDISFNNIALQGQTVSFGNNRVSGNVNVGTAPSAPSGGAGSL